MNSLIDHLSEADRKALEARWAEAIRQEREARAKAAEVVKVEPTPVVLRGKKLVTCQQFGVLISAQMRERRGLR